MREPQLAHEEVVKLEGQPARDVGIGPLLVRQPDVKPNSSSAGLGSAAIGGLHNSGTTSRADHVSVNVGLKALRPNRDQSPEFARLLVVASERTVGRKPPRAE